MSREERRQYQRTAGRRATSPYPTPPGRRQGRGGPPDRSRAAVSRAQPAASVDLRLTPRFWVRTLVGAAIVGLLLLSVSWDPATRPGTDSLLYGVVAALAFVIGMVGYRLVRRRLQQREPG